MSSELLTHSRTPQQSSELLTHSHTPEQQQQSVGAASWHGSQADESEDAHSSSDPLVDEADLNREQNRGGRVPRSGHGCGRWGGRGRDRKRSAAGADVELASRGRGRGHRGRGRKSSTAGGAEQRAGAAFLRTQLKRTRHHSPARQPDNSSSATIGGSSGLPAPRAGRPRAGRPKTVCVSLTAVVPNADIPMTVFDAIAAYMKHHTHGGSVSTERGGAFQHLHVQGVLKQRSTSSRSIKSALHRYLQQHVQNYDALGVQLCCKQAANKGLHTWEGLVGYSRKYQGRADFQNVLHNVSVFDIEEGEKLLRLHGSAMKHRIALTHHNLMERAAAFLEFELRGRFDVSLNAVVWAMLASGQYFLDPVWAVPALGSGMVAERADVVWRSCIAPSSITSADVDVALFKVEWGAHALAANGIVPTTARTAQHDDALREIVLEAQRTDSKVGHIVDSRPALRALLFDRAADHVLQPQPQRGRRLEAQQQRSLQALHADQDVRWHADVLHHDQRNASSSGDDAVPADPAAADRPHDAVGVPLMRDDAAACALLTQRERHLTPDEFAAAYNADAAAMQGLQHESLLQRWRREKEERKRQRRMLEDDD